MKTERRLITVLFADIVRSSDIVKNHDPEIAENIFSRVISPQIEITKKYHGTVNQVMGDGIMCLFGAAPPYEEHALRAVLAGQEMLRNVLDFPIENRNLYARIRIGINTGEVVLAPSGNDQYRATFQTTGTAVHIADRILKTALENQLLVSSHTRKFIDRYLHLKKSGALEWHKEEKLIQLYEPTLPKQARLLRTIATDKKSIPRLSLEERLVALTDAGQKHKPGIIWLQGAAGMGKTHLVGSFIRKYGRHAYKKILQVNFYPDPLSHKKNDFEQTILEGLLNKDRTYILKNAAEISKELDPAKSSLFGDCIKDVFTASGMTEAYVALDRASRQRLKLDMISRLLLSKSKDEKILLILEDLHWAKEDALSYIEQICHLCSSCENVLILGTSRKDHPLGRTVEDIKIKKIILEPMTLHESLHLLKSLDSQKTLPPSLKNKIYRLSGGNPFFIQEYFSWVQTSISENRSLQAIKKRLDEHAPGTIADVLYNKLAAVGEDVAETAKLAAMLGMRINFEVLLAVGKQDRKSLLSHLLQLEDAGIINKDRSFPAPEWIFVHELLQKVIYNSIPLSQRSALHAEVIRQLKKNAFRSLDNRHLIMAFHAGKSGDDLLKYIYSKWSAREENSQSRYKSSIACSVASRQVLVRVGGRNTQLKHEVKARIFEISNLFITGKYSAARKHIKLLLKRKNILIKLGQLDRVLSFQALYLWVKGDLVKAAKISRTILSLNVLNNRRETYINESTRLAGIYTGLGRYEEVLKYDLKMVKLIADEDREKKFGSLTYPKPAAYSRLAYAYAELGQLKKSQKYFDLAEEFLQGSGDYFTKIYIIIYLVNGLIIQDKNRQALELLKTACGYCEKFDAALLEPLVLSAYGVTLAKLGKTEEGERLCCRALMQAKQNKVSSGYAQLVLRYAETLLGGGQRQMAIRQLKYAVTLASRRQEAGTLAGAYMLLGCCYQERNNTDTNRARGYFQRALRIVRKRHMLTVEKKINVLTQESSFDQKVYELSD